MSLKKLAAPLGLLALLAGQGSAQAQLIGVNAGELPAEQQSRFNAPSASDQAAQNSNTQWRNARYGVPGATMAQEDYPSFGSHLFTGGFSGVRADGLNPDYIITPGDQVTLRVWGAVEIDRVLPVDAQGNIFIPGVGPIKVQGIKHGQLDAKVRSAVNSIYSNNVQVYTNLQGVQPVSVFVTGYVQNPGRFAGTPSDSLLYFIDQAGGIDSATGSYRKVRVQRHGKTQATADLYAFLLNGTLPNLQLKDGDTIVVEERGPTVTVDGDVARPYRYELLPNNMSGQALLNLARLKSNVTHVLLRGVRTQGPVSSYVELNELGQQSLKSGDQVIFSSDLRDDTIVVQLEGSYYGPSRFALPRDARLHELLNAVAVPQNMTDTNSISLKRVSVAERQKQALDESLARLETTYMGASSSTPEEAEIRVREAELISQFIERAREVEPNGRLVLANNGQISDIRLQDGDVITIPEASDSVLISGEVLVPQSVVFNANRSARDYIEGAGGFTDHANESRILVVRQNGEVREADDVTLRPGDEILVLPKAPTKNLQLAGTITQILYQIAIAAKVAVDI
ncbi:polysaccharide biosynthesis/export family protein [Oceanimonas baumannii]|uniref:Capsid assembly protein n=1 Tax=Oceanimonas baumannii TaxID=129578 RepID=A0A235CMP9_9GAMM|nr:polysaccharide biosynthesis/export family protein [Oceanimonas baumannii]OYD25654.1 capsid assembly protein [Oceanimonas baumannii]TDW56968.1 protein involved in polysaccharide export with SLBB domain [Oceanimonas baumannii]